MRRQTRLPPALAALLAFGLVGCSDTGFSLGQPSFRSGYETARSALDSGDHQKAVRSYAPLLGIAGPATARVQLEYAHALLRAGDYDMASAQAQAAAGLLDGMARASALAVQASADQEIVSRAIAAGQADDAVRARYDAALGAMDFVLTSYPQMDPAGGLAARRALLVQSGAGLPAAL